MRVVIVALVVVLSMGCRSPKGVLFSLEDVVAESKVTGLFSKRGHRVSSALAPFLHPKGVGTVYKLSTSKHSTPQQAWGVSSSDRSYGLVALFESDATPKHLETIRSGLVRLRATAFEAATHLLDAARFEAIGEKSKANLARTKAANLRKALTSAENDLYSKITEKNVVVFRWTAANRASSSARAGGLARAGGASASHYDGFAIVAGLRATRLYVGLDIVNVFDGFKNAGNLRVVTYSLAARHILYGSTGKSERAFAARLSATKKQLEGKSLASTDLIEAQLVLSSVQIGANFGTLSEPTFKRYRAPFSFGTPKEPSSEARITDNDKYTPFYQIDTDVRSFKSAAELVRRAKGRLAELRRLQPDPP